MKYFIVKTGYNPEDFIPIDETELEIAMKCFLTNAKGVFKKGVVRGQDIISIKEDWHREFGWNYGYKLGPEDFQQITTGGTHYAGVIEEVKQKLLANPKLLNEAH